MLYCLSRSPKKDLYYDDRSAPSFLRSWSQVLVEEVYLAVINSPTPGGAEKRHMRSLDDFNFFYYF